jgi:hypothetical protein
VSDAVKSSKIKTKDPCQLTAVDEYDPKIPSWVQVIIALSQPHVQLS